MKRYVLNIRPDEDSAALDAEIKSCGYEPLSSPALRIEPVDAPVTIPADLQGVVFTSRHAVRIFSEKTSWRGGPVYVVGEATARAAIEAGFTDVAGTAGTVQTLEMFLRRRITDQTRPLLYVSGEQVSRDLDLPGVNLVRLVIYRAAPANDLTPPVYEALRQGAVEAVLFYSRRSAESFVRLFSEGGLDKDKLMKTKALCLSYGVVESLQNLPWEALRVAPQPDQEGMKILLARLATPEARPVGERAEEKEVPAAAETMLMSIPEKITPFIVTDEAIANAGALIARFGGIRPMATKMKVPVTTVQGWKKRDVIPAGRRADILRAAQEHNIDVGTLLDAPVSNPAPAVTPPPPDAAPVAPAAAAQEWVLPPVVPAPPPSSIAVKEMPKEPPAAPSLSEEMLMTKLKQAEKQAVRKSALVSVALIAAAAVGFAVLLGPGMQKRLNGADHEAAARLAAMESEVARLEGNMQAVEQKQSLLQRLVPEDLSATVADIKAQAVEAKQSATALARQVGDMAGSVMGPQAGDMTQRLGRLEQQFAGFTGSGDFTALIDRMHQMQQTLEGQQKLAASVEQLNTIVGGLQGRMDKLDGELAQAQTGQGALGQTLEGVSPTDLKAAALLMGLVQFRTSVNRNAPFDQDLALLQSMLGPEDPALNDAITRLAPQAQQGVLSPAGLSGELRGLAGEIVVASLQGEDVSLKEKAKARLNDVLQVKKDGELVTGTDTQARIDRAQALLDQGDVNGAIAELETLQGPARDTAQPVIDQAKMTALAQKVQMMLTERVTARLQAPGSAPYTTGGGVGALLDDISGAVGNAAGHVVSDPTGSVNILPAGPSLPSSPQP